MGGTALHISKRSVFYSVFALTLSNLGLQLLGFVYRIFLSRMTGAEGMGVYQLVFPYYSVLMAITLSGLAMAVSQISAEYDAFGDDFGARRTVRACLGIFSVIFVCVAVPTFLYSDWISKTLLGDGRTRIALLIFLPCLFCTGFENIYKNYFFGTNYVKAPIISELSEQIVRILAVGALLLTFRPQDPGIAAALIACGMVVSEIVSAVVLTGFYKNRAPRLCARRTNPLSAPQLIRKIGVIAVPVSFAGLLNNLLSSANSVLIPRRLIASGLGASQAVSAFGVLFGMTMPLLSFPIAFIAPLTTVAVPKLSEGLAVSNLTDMRRKAGKVIHATGLLAFPAMATMIPLGASACRLLYNQPDSGAYMLPLCIATLFTYYQITTTAILNGVGMQRRAAAIILVGGVLELGFTWSVGFPGVGIKGFVAGYIVSSVLMALLNMACVVRRLKIRIRWRNWFVTPFLCACLAGLVSHWLHAILQQEGFRPWPALLLSLAGSALIYVLTLRLHGTSIVRYVKTLIPRRP